MNSLAFIIWSVRLAVVFAFTVERLPQENVIVTGAAGRTGKLIFESLSRNAKYDPIGLVRTERSAKRLIQDVKYCLERIWVCDVTNLDPNDNTGLPKGLSEAKAMIICTSAVPILRKRSVVKALLKIPINILSRKKAFQFREVQFRYGEDQYPEKVDYLGQVAQIDLAKRLGISHIVLVSSMGVTNPGDFLNSIGKEKDGSGHGDILIWKKKAEQYLMESGLDYTIIHPGHLKDLPGGVSNIVLDIDDKLRSHTGAYISRADLASLCIASLTTGEGEKLIFDCISRNCDDGEEVTPVTTTISDFMQRSMQLT